MHIKFFILALSTQLAMTNSQLLTAETALETLKNSKTQSDHRFYMLQQEKVSLETRNSEMLEVITLNLYNKMRNIFPNTQKCWVIVLDKM